MRSARGSSRALACSTALVLVLLSSAHEELPQSDSSLQQEADLTELLNPREFQAPQSIMQREEDLTDLLDFKDMDMFLQRPVEIPLPEGIGQELPGRASVPQREEDLTVHLNTEGVSRPEFLRPRGGRPVVGPRSFAPALNYPVQFPLGRPTSENIQAICLHGDLRPRYPTSYFPASGFGKLRRKATAVNNAEFWFSTCCKESQNWPSHMVLCCATQAWKLSHDLLCEEDSSVKDTQDDCCLKRGSERLNCFNEEAENPNYQPTMEIPVVSVPPTSSFTFNPSSCQRSGMISASVLAPTPIRKAKRKPAAYQKVNFPLGQPTADNIESLCRMQNLRPLYTTRCPPRSGYKVLALQARSINRLERGLTQCCGKQHGVLDCAEQKWREEVNKFCSTVKRGKLDFHCCSGDGAPDRYACFKLNSPDPHYNMISASEELSLNKLCDVHNIIRKRFPVGFPLKTFVSQCCPLPEQDRASCSVQQMKEISQNLCSSNQTSPPAVRRCCKMASEEERLQCLSEIAMDAVNKATNFLRQKTRRCPLS